MLVGTSEIKVANEGYFDMVFFYVEEFINSDPEQCGL